MPSEQLIGKPSAANDTIGGIPKLHYFDFYSRGRGQVLRLMWEDAGIAYEDIRYTFDEYPKYKESLLSKLNPAGTIPIVEINGKVLTQSYPILRHHARLLGKYEGKNEDEIYYTDIINDLVHDWRTLFVTAAFSPDKEKAMPAHQKGDRARFLAAIEAQMGSHPVAKAAPEGPYLLGPDPTYADFTLYQILHDEELNRDGAKGLGEYPRLKKLVEAMEARPKVKEFMQGDRYKG